MTTAHIPDSLTDIIYHNQLILIGVSKMRQAADSFGLTFEEFAVVSIRSMEYADAHPPFWEKPQYGGL